MFYLIVEFSRRPARRITWLIMYSILTVRSCSSISSCWDSWLSLPTAFNNKKLTLHSSVGRQKLSKNVLRRRLSIQMQVIFYFTFSNIAFAYLYFQALNFSIRLDFQISEIRGVCLRCRRSLKSIRIFSSLKFFK